MNKTGLTVICLLILGLFAVGHPADRLVLAEYFTNAG